MTFSHDPINFRKIVHYSETLRWFYASAKYQKYFVSLQKPKANSASPFGSNYAMQCAMRHPKKEFYRSHFTKPFMLWIWMTINVKLTQHFTNILITVIDNYSVINDKLKFHHVNSEQRAVWAYCSSGIRYVRWLCWTLRLK